MQTLKSKRLVTDIINDIFNESLDAKKKSQLREAEDLFGDPKDDEQKDSTEEKEKTDLDKDANPSDAAKLKSGEITAEDVVEKLNTIRSGKSFKDEDIMSKMGEYIDGLKKAEKTALLTFLKALSQIVTGEVSAKEVITPSEKPVDIKMEKEPAVKKRTIKPTVIKMNPAEDENKKTPAEDSKGPVPIVAKKK